MRFRFRLRPLVTIAPKVSPDPAQAAELARRRAELSYVPNNGFLVEPAPGPRFAAAPVVEATPEQVLELVQAPAQDPTAQPVAPQSPVERTSEVAAPADWSEFDSPAWERRGRPDPMRRSSHELLLPLPSILRRQAQ